MQKYLYAKKFEIIIFCDILLWNMFIYTITALISWKSPHKCKESYNVYNVYELTSTFHSTSV